MKLISFLAILFFACQTKQKPAVVMAEEETAPVDLSSIGEMKLSSYQFFAGDLKELRPAENVYPYSLNSALFSDYAYKKRFVKISKGTKIKYNATDVLDFPEGTILIKNFYYPSDFRKPESEKRILETRLLILEKGVWKALPYIWNKAQTEAYLEVAGKNIDVKWIHTDGEIRQVNYTVPNINQCKGCHLRGEKIFPIGPSARQLNNSTKNIVVEWAHENILEGLPPLHQIPRLASYENASEPIDKRARAWLEINCAHCHRKDGPAKTSGLHLLADVEESTVLGIGKSPIAAGKGSGGRLYGIVPGKPDESILQYRIESLHPGIMMPELGRKLVHEEGVELVRRWIVEMK
jgi:uncharacterized repeat protein (TIGR03806 family)